MAKSEQRWLLIGSICVYNLASFGWWAQPEIFHTVMEDFSLTESSAGFFVSAEFIALAFTAFITAPFLGRLSLRTTCYIAGVVAILCHFLSASVTDYTLLLSLRICAGIAEGIVLAIANAVIASTPDPDRSYAILNTWNVASGVFLLVLITVAPMVLPIAKNYTLVFVLIALSCLAMLPLTKHIPKKIGMVENHHIPTNIKISGGLLIAGMLIWGSPSASIWALMFGLGERTTLSSEMVGLVVAAAALGGLVGGTIAARLGGQDGRLKPLIYGFIVHSIIAILISQQTNGTFFMILAPLAIACVYFLLPYFLGVAAYLDPRGALPATVAGMFLLTGATGPVLGGYLLEVWGFQAIGWSVTIGAIIAFLFILYILGPQEQRQES